MLIIDNVTTDDDSLMCFQVKAFCEIDHNSND